MNPSSNETGLNLPPPVTEQAPTPQTTGEALPVLPETRPEMAATGAGEANIATARAAVPAIPVPPITDNTTIAPAAASAVTPGLADDTDLIEKEWVEKAKQIIEKTRNDPYEQSKGITVIKADYMKKRYNKTIKASE